MYLDIHVFIYVLFFQITSIATSQNHGHDFNPIALRMVKTVLSAIGLTVKGTFFYSPL